MLAPNTILQGRYRIIRQLGHGGMGAVYEALNERVSSVVALKETFAETEVERKAFEREAKLLANLEHDAFPRVMDHFFENDGQYLVMELIRGTDLAELLALRESPFAPAKVLGWADQLLDALEALHASSPPIIHRDIKPSNLKLTRQDKIKLLDFGIAKGAVGQMTTLQSNQSMGGHTPHYASLEQTLRADRRWREALSVNYPEAVEKIVSFSTDPCSDLYALGATVYHLMTGCIPVDAPARALSVWSGKQDRLQPAHEVNPQVPSAISAVLIRAMALERNERPQSAREMRRLLREAVNVPMSVPPTELSREIEEQAHQRREEEARRRAEEEQRRQERAEALRLREEARQRAEEERRRRETEEAESQRAAEETHRKAEEAHREEERQKREAEEVERQRAAVPTLPVSHTPRLYSSGKPSRPFIDAITKVQGNRRVLVIVGVTLAIVLAGVVIMWLLRTKADETRLPGANQTQMGQQEREKIVSVPTPPSAMVYVPGGEFTMGRDDGDQYERPAHKVTVMPFFIDIYEVANEEYEKFVVETGWPPPPTWPNMTYPPRSPLYPPGTPRKPVTGVNWEDARAYAKWAGKRLPTEEEWEFAARGTDGRLYPWGNNWRDGLANTDGVSTGMADVGASAASPFGALDMVGNAWEWTASDMTAYPGGKLPRKPAVGTKVLRGGSYKSNKIQATATYRFGWRASGEASYAETGFRCVKDVADMPTAP
jgi:formylglycine-generating enzyme required for sulfatase activity